MKIGMIGLGYVGLTSAVCFANRGHEVIGHDLSSEKLSQLKKGKSPIWEPLLEEQLQQALQQKTIHFTDDISAVIHQSEILFVAVGTPSQADGQADLSQIWNVISQIKKYSQSEQVLVIKSTVPIGTTDQIAQQLDKIGSPLLDIIHNPEFLRQGQAMNDFLHPDRIVIGYHQALALEKMKHLYKSFSTPIIACDRKSAEMIKYASNSFLAMKISYINMMASLCEQLGGNVDAVAEGVGADQRIGHSFLHAGVGYGGSCFPKDTQALLAMGKAYQQALPLVQATIQINQEQPFRLLERLEKRLSSFENKKITLMGLSFKAGTDDLREAPSIKISQKLISQGANIHAYDPVVRSFPVKEVFCHEDPLIAVQDADAVLFLTDWDEFRHLPWKKLAQALKQPILVDGRNLFSLDHMRKTVDTYGFEYISVGRPTLFSSTPTQDRIE
ncbi:UDP-glucose dehydrogenase family protein [Hazenella coriacea]|uniref:UDP-glucose 6-dehydrogenase n=1 Tax=Hazenella coriacea TaxID=1179467 RepID=A0A4R3L9U4_9BACL|nr:UDP-glucose/GDP-mannose dehydrogenase family protein [Hazenella coriacea]TCS95895.1 UDPglucose 6-dehydrogenase [Hazenella coriacea]